jgi:hypothetical protein
MGDVIDFSEAKKGREAKSRRGGGLKMWVDENLRLQVRDINGDGKELAEWSCKPEDTEPLLRRLSCQLWQAKSKKAREAAPLASPRKPRKHKCRLTRESNMGPTGCRRLRGHEGPHKDAKGTWTAAFPHERFCTTIYSGVPSGSKVKVVMVPESMQPMVGKMVYIRIGPDGRCLACGNRVHLEVIK